MAADLRTTTFQARDYDLAATLTSGQAFRWELQNDVWIGVLRHRWVGLRQQGDQIVATAVEPSNGWEWLTEYLQVEVDIETIVQSFPSDEPMRQAVHYCHGLRLLRQDPWECLASFILSSSKQIVQIRQIVAALCRHFGEPVAVPPGAPRAFAFPTPDRLASVAEADLRTCKMGYRAPYLLGTAQAVAGGFNLERLRSLPVESAREQLLTLPGVGRKVADCILLFAYGFQEAFPVDVWVMKALRELYFPKRRVKLKRLQHFAATHFGPFSGYAQQYLFHYMRLQNRTNQVTTERNS